jgi:hypothetical protein
MTPEGRVKAACLHYLEKRGITAWNNPSGALPTLSIAGGRFIAHSKGKDITGELPASVLKAI